MLKTKRFWVSLGLAVVFLGLFLYRVDFSQLFHSLLKANYIFFVPAIAVYFIGAWLRAVRWRFLLLSLGRFPPHRLFSPIIIGFTLNNILPARVGLVARAYILGQREGISKIASGATVIVDQLFDGLALLFYLEAISLFVPLPGWARAVTLAAAIAFLGLFLILLSLALSPRLTRWLTTGPLTHRLPRGWQSLVEQGIERARAGLASLHRPDQLVLAFLLSLLVWLAEASMYYIISLSFRLEQPFYIILLFTAIANIAITLPSLPGGIGPFELFGKETLTLFGVEESLATAYVAALHAAVLLPVTLLGLGFMAMGHFQVAEIVQAGRNKN